MGEQERERLQRLRDEQIRARDPGKSKIRGYDWERHAEHGREINAKRAKEAQKPLLIALYQALPERLQAAIIAFLIGLIPAVAGLILLDGEWRMLAIIPPLVLAALGYLIGMMLEPDRDLYM
jgi:uncharacterized membrane protein